MDEWIKKMWYIYVCVCVCILYILYKMEYFSHKKKNKILTFATTWMNLEGIQLREISQRKTNIV